MDEQTLSEVEVSDGLRGASVGALLGYVLTGILFFVLVFWLIVRLKRALTQPELQGLRREEIEQRWRSIRSMSSQSDMGMKLAIMEADTLLDSALKSLSMPGKTLGERLRFAAHKYPRINSVWSAHTLRNRLAHEASFRLTPRQAKAALDDFEKAFHILNLM